MAKRKTFGNLLDKEFPIILGENAVDKFFSELTEREKLLFEYYGIERPENIPHQARVLIIKMAQNAGIIGFMELPPKVGKPNLWAGKYGKLFWVRVKLQIYKKPTVSLRNNISIVKNKYDYKEPLDSLYVRYSEVCKNIEIQFIDKLMARLIESPEYTCNTSEEVLLHLASMLENDDDDSQAQEFQLLSSYLTFGSRQD